MNPPRPDEPLQVRLSRDFFWRHGLIGGLLLFFCLLLLPALGPLGPLRFLAPLVFLGPWLVMVLRQWCLAVRWIDGEGVTRYDGRRFSWNDFERIQEVNLWRYDRPVGPLNHVDLLFTTGRARILPRIAENGWEAIASVRRRGEAGKPPEPPAAGPAPLPEVAERPAPVLADPPAADGDATVDSPTAPCATCGDLGSYHRGLQKHGREAEDSFLPPAASQLRTVKESRPGRPTSPTLKRCPRCGAWFYYKETYEYFADGGEDDQELRRLTPEEAAAFLRGESGDGWLV